MVETTRKINQDAGEAGGYWGAMAPGVSITITGTDSDYAYQADTGTVTAIPPLIEISGNAADYAVVSEQGMIVQGVRGQGAGGRAPRSSRMLVLSDRRLSERALIEEAARQAAAVKPLRNPLAFHVPSTPARVSVATSQMAEPQAVPRGVSSQLKSSVMRGFSEQPREALPPRAPERRTAIATARRIASTRKVFGG